MMVEEITVGQLKVRLDKGDDLLLLDVRETDERQFANIGGEFIPLSILGVKFRELHRDKEIVVYCHHGNRSYHAAMFLMKNGFNRVLNLAGGIDAWSVLIDPKIKRY